MAVVNRRINRPCEIRSPGMSVKDPETGSWGSQEGPVRFSVWEVQQQSSQAQNGVTTSATRWLGLFRSGTVVSVDDSIVCDGETWSVVGEPWQVRSPRTGNASHVQAEVMLVTGRGSQSV